MPAFRPLAQSGPFAATLLALALAVAPALVPAEGPPEPAAPQKLVLDPLDLRDVQKALGAAVELKVCQSLSEASPGVDLVCPEDVAAAMAIARQDAVMGRCASEDCVKRVEEMRAGPRRVTGALVRDGKGVSLRLDLREGMKEPRTVQARLPEDLEALLGAVPALVRQLLAAK
jgi:hypothetical protein